MVGEVTAEIRRRCPICRAAARVLERLLTGRVAELVFAGEEAAARAAMRRRTSPARRGADTIGTVFLVGAGPVPPTC